MYKYHGWLSTCNSMNVEELKQRLHDLNDQYPVSVEYVNGELHIAFSGGPNRNLGHVDNIVSYLCGLEAKMSGCVYTNDANSERVNKFDVIKIVEDRSTIIEDRNFTTEEKKQIFE